MSRKRSDFVMQYVSLAVLAVVFMGSGLTKAVAYGAEVAAVSAVEEPEAEILEEDGTDGLGELEEDGWVTMGSPLEDEETVVKITDFSVKLLSDTLLSDTDTEGKKNILLSPYSVITALSMTANGAAGDTRTQMEQVFGMTAEELRTYLSNHQKSLDEEKGNVLSCANSIWFKEEESLSFNPEFLDTAQEWYDARIDAVPMDESSLKEINGWVNEKTKGMIPEILNEIPEDAIMYLINALAFDGEWEEIYREDQIYPGTFTREDGSTQETEFMYSEEYRYLEDEGAEGFLKNYKGGKYAFAALLPDEGTSLEEYVKGLTGERLYQVIASAQEHEVQAAIPKFRTEYSIELSKVLSGMGMTDAFSPEDADFTGICTSGEGNAYIGRVLHRTCMEVNEKGTKAGAVTAVEMLMECAMEAEPAKVIHLDRPFVYMLLDCESGLPIFLGTVTGI